MTTSQSEVEVTEEAVEEVSAPDPLAEYAMEVARAVGGEVADAVRTIKVKVDASRWREVLRIARDELGLVYFSFLSAIDWANEVAVGDPLEDEVEERFEVIAAVGDLGQGRLVIFSADVGKQRPEIDSLVGVYAGADWHERETHEMFGIEFRGHPNLVHLYLPNGFQGHPLRKSFPLLSREVKPWPGKVDVEDMPSEEEEEAPAAETEGEASTENPEA